MTINKQLWNKCYPTLSSTFTSLFFYLKKKHNIHTVSGIRLTLSGNGTVKIRFNLHTSMERHQHRLILTYFRLGSVFYFKNTEYRKKRETN